MPEKTTQQELNERVALIEAMIAEGRRGTESWGWTFVLWGVAYYVALGWSAWGPWAVWAWPITMIAALVLMFVIVSRNEKRETEPRVETTVGRAVFSVWIAMGISMFLLLLFVGLSGRFNVHLFIAVVGSMLGLANAASSMILRWKVQSGCAIIWWASAAAACFTSLQLTTAAFLAAIFFCQIVFGIYCMMAEARERRERGAAHA